MLSVIVPFYNTEKYLSQCLESVAKQTLDDYEIILINDGSNDNSDKIAIEFVNNHSNVRYFKKENGGLMSAYLFALDYVNGDYVGFVDSDDIVDNTMFEMMYKSAKQYNADIVMCDEKRLVGEPVFSKDDNPQILFYDLENMDYICKNVFPPFNKTHVINNSRVNKIFKSEIIYKIKPYLLCKSRFFEDRFFTVACVFNSNSFLWIKKDLYHYRKNEVGHSNSTKASDDLYNAIKKLAEVQKNILVDSNQYERYLTNYELACLNHLGLFIDRNILLSKPPFKKKMFYAKQIINDDFYRILVKKYKKDLTCKKGFLIKISFALQSPFVLAFLSLFKR